MADQDDVIVVAGEPARLGVHLVHQRAGGINDPQTALLRQLTDRWCHAVSAEHDGGPIGHVVQVVDKNDPALQVLPDQRLVVDDLMEGVDGRSKQRKRPIERLDRHLDSGAKPPGIRE
jgi:hypothetical protein